MRFATVSSPHLHSGASVTRLMGEVLLALVPGIAAHLWYFGWGLAVSLAVAVPVALACEIAMLRLRGRAVRTYAGDLSAVLTAVLLALTLPPLTPWWMVVLGVAFAIIVGKHLYGGIGYNPFNPAMLGFVVLIICFPREMTSWTAAAPLARDALGLLDTLRFVFLDQLPAGLALDSITAATPLDHIKLQLSMNRTVPEALGDPLFGSVGGQGFEVVALGYLVGGACLLATRRIAWQIPTGVLGGMALVALVFWIYDADTYASPLFHVVGGATLLGAFFIATDPVTASTTPAGRLIFGAGIGILTYLIRTFGGFPDGIAFAVLFMNILAPTLDHYTQPRIYGQPRT